MQNLVELAPDPIAVTGSRPEVAVENSSTLKAFAVLEILVAERQADDAGAT